MKVYCAGLQKETIPGPSTIGDLLKSEMASKETTTAAETEEPAAEAETAAEAAPEEEAVEAETAAEAAPEEEAVEAETAAEVAPEEEAVEAETAAEAAPEEEAVEAAPEEEAAASPRQPQKKQTQLTLLKTRKNKLFLTGRSACAADEFISSKTSYTFRTFHINRDILPFFRRNVPAYFFTYFDMVPNLIFSAERRGWNR